MWRPFCVCQLFPSMGPELWLLYPVGKNQFSLSQPLPIANSYFKIAIHIFFYSISLHLQNKLPCAVLYLNVSGALGTGAWICWTSSTRLLLGHTFDYTVSQPLGAVCSFRDVAHGNRMSPVSTGNPEDQGRACLPCLLSTTE